MKFASDQLNPPLCAVVSEKDVQLLCFPYTTDEQLLAVDCICLPQMPLFLDAALGASKALHINEYLLALILLLCGEESYSTIYPFAPMKLAGAVPKGNVKEHICSYEEKAAEALTQALQREEESQREIKRLSDIIDSLKTRTKDGNN